MSRASSGSARTKVRMKRCRLGKEGNSDRRKKTQNLLIMHHVRKVYCTNDEQYSSRASLHIALPLAGCLWESQVERRDCSSHIRAILSADGIISICAVTTGVSMRVRAGHYLACTSSSSGPDDDVTRNKRRKWAEAQLEPRKGVITLHPHLAAYFDLVFLSVRFQPRNATESEQWAPFHKST